MKVTLLQRHGEITIEVDEVYVTTEYVEGIRREISLHEDGINVRIVRDVDGDDVDLLDKDMTFEEFLPLPEGTELSHEN